MVFSGPESYAFSLVCVWTDTPLCVQVLCVGGRKRIRLAELAALRHKVGYPAIHHNRDILKASPAQRDLASRSHAYVDRGFELLRHAPIIVLGLGQDTARQETKAR